MHLDVYGLPCEFQLMLLSLLLALPPFAPGPGTFQTQPGWWSKPIQQKSSQVWLELKTHLETTNQQQNTHGMVDDIRATQKQRFHLSFFHRSSNGGWRSPYDERPTAFTLDRLNGCAWHHEHRAHPHKMLPSSTFSRCECTQETRASCHTSSILPFAAAEQLAELMVINAGSWGG